MSNPYGIPFPLHDYQEQGVEDLAPLDCSLLSYSVGLGKTVVSLVAALNAAMTTGVSQIWVLAPPILLDQWASFLGQVESIPSIGIYRGTPTERILMDMDESIVLCSYNIFRGKRDHKRFIALAKQETVCIIADELSLKSLKSQTYRKLKQLLYRKLRLSLGDKPFHKLIALNATPISDLSHVYNWCSLMLPGLYVSKRLFEAAHVESQNHWGVVTEWKNEGLMLENMNLFTVDTDEEIELPPLVESVIPYDLSPAHMKLYMEVQASELANLPEDKIELALNSMFSTLQRLVLVPREFGLDIDPPVLEFIKGYLDQAGDGGVVLYTRHRITSKSLSEELGIPAVYGGTKDRERKAIIEGLKDKSITKVVGSMDSISHGLNLQALNHLIFVEFPFRSDKLIQCIGRVHRQGQKSTCFANYPMAKHTIQEQIYYKLLKNEKDLMPFLKTKEAVREFIS